MKYIVSKDFSRNGIDGFFDLPVGTEVEENRGWLYYSGKRICSDRAAVMREYFASNEDGNGLVRAELTKRIKNKMQIQEGETREEWDARWESLYNDPVCSKYRKDAEGSSFIWSIDFFNAPLEDLHYIAHLVGIE